MSNDTNSELMERALTAIGYFEGKLPAQIIEKDLEDGDLEALLYHVKQAEAVMSQEIIEASDVY